MRLIRKGKRVSSLPSSISVQKRGRKRHLSPFLSFSVTCFFLCWVFLGGPCLPGKGEGISPCKAQQTTQKGDSTEISVDIIEEDKPSPPPPTPPSPRTDDTTAPTRIVPGNKPPGDQGQSSEKGPKINADCWGMAKSPTTGRVDGVVNMPANCWLHFGKDPEKPNDRVIGPYQTNQTLKVIYELEGLTPKTKYYFQIEAHSLEYSGLTGWSPVRSFQTPGGEIGVIASGNGNGGNPKKGIPWWFWMLLGTLLLLPLWWFILWKRLTDYVLAPIEGYVLFHEEGQSPDDPPVVSPRQRIAKGNPLFWMRAFDGNTMIVYSEENIKILKVLLENDNESVDEHERILKVRRKWREALLAIKDDRKGPFYGWEWLSS